jgi:hypothetical protein
VAGSEIHSDPDVPGKTFGKAMARMMMRTPVPGMFSLKVCNGVQRRKQCKLLNAMALHFPSMLMLDEQSVYSSDWQDTH